MDTIEPIIKDIKVSKSQSFWGFNFPIQLPTLRTIHRFQGLSLDELIFDPTNVKKHGLTCTTLSPIQTKEILFMLVHFQHEFFNVDQWVHVKMNRLQIITTWIPLIP
jgi:hypothetical protein